MRADHLVETMPARIRELGMQFTRRALDTGVEVLEPDGTSPLAYVAATLAYADALRVGWSAAQAAMLAADTYAVAHTLVIDTLREVAADIAIKN